MNTFPRLKQLPVSAPVAEKLPFTAEHHGKELSDPWQWMKDPGYPEVDDKNVLDYLNAENSYYHTWLKPHQAFADKIFEEFKGRVDETETSVPYIQNGFEYRWFYREGEDYRVRSRKNLKTGEENVFLDENELSKGHEYFVLGDWDVSSDNRYLAYSIDVSGDERYEIYIKDLETGELLADKLKDAQSDITFTSDGKSLIYALLEQDRWHAKHLNAHKLGTKQTTDQTLFHEPDEGFFIGFDLTSSREFLIVSSSQGETEEAWVIPSDLSGKLTLLASRDEALDYQVDHAHGHFYILANDTHKNFRLARVSDKAPAYQNWQTLQEGTDDVYLMKLQTFDKFMAITSRELGYEKIQVRSYQGVNTHIEFPEAVCSLGLNVNPEFAQSHLRVSYESMITPHTVYDYQIETTELVSRKVQKIPAGYDKALYETERVMITARDGVKVPVSLVYKKGLKKMVAIRCGSTATAHMDQP